MLIETFLFLMLLAVAAGFVGAMLGLGGGIILVPGLTLLFHYDVKIAIAASLVSVIATSSAAATVYVSERFANIRLGMLLEIATTTGALIGGIVAVHVPSKYLYFVFAAILVYAGTMMLRGRRESVGTITGAPANGLGETYLDPRSGRTVAYEVTKVPLGMTGSLGAGLMSGLLGVGGGIIKVPLMNLGMRIPMKAAIATSNFMIGVTAATGAIVFWLNGKIDPAVAAPTVIGVLVGARLGTRVAGRARSRYLVFAFVLLIGVTAVQMVLKGIGAK